MVSNSKYTLFLFLFFLNTLVAFAGYGIGTPFTESFSAEEYKAGSQNWDITQDSRFVMYFANDEGLLEFDGSNWNVFPLPNKTIVRSVEVNKDGLIYAGGQNEFGRFKPNALGAWEFESLKESIPIESRNFEDVWDLSLIDDRIIFRSAGKLYYQKNNQWRIEDSLSIKFLKNVNDKIIVQDNSGLLFWYEQEQWKKINGSENLLGSTLTGLISLNEDHFLVTTVEDGIFEFTNNSISKWTTSLDDFFAENFINCATQLYDGSIALGSYLGGLVIIDANGNIQHHLTKNDGLLSNNISSLYNDANHNLWVGIDNGISHVKVNFPFLKIYPDKELEGAGFAVKVFDEKIYFGTSNGLYNKSWPEEPLKLADLKNFTPVKGTSGQNWGLDIIDNELILSHHKGAFYIKENDAFEALTETGVWLIDKYKNDQNIAGTYEGVKFYNQQYKNFTEIKLHSEFKESSRFLEQDDKGNIWISHPYRGVFKLTPKEDSLMVTHFDSEDGLESDLHNHLFKINGEIIVCGEQTILAYDENSNQFIPHVALNNVFGNDIKIRRLFEAANNDIWFVTEDKVGLLKVTERLLEKDIEKIEFPELRSLLNNGFELIYPYNDEHVFFTARQGFVHYLPKKQLATDSSFQLILNEVSVHSKSDSVIFSGVFAKNGSISTQQPDAMKYQLERQIRGLQFTYSAIDFMNNDELQFRYKLLGYEEDKWSEWTDKRVKEYTNLPAGEYSFKIQASKINGQLTPVFSYDFSIKKLWYTTLVAKLIYAFLISMLTFLIFRRNHKKLKIVRAAADESVKRSQEEIDRLEKENIKSQLEHKNRELVSSALHISRKNEILNQLTDKINKIEKECADESTVNELKKLKYLLRNEEIVEEGWENHMLHFNELNGEYINQLKKKYTKLSPKDLKLCTYLKMNLTTKEIASIMNVSIRAVEASRYRLRKKMDLSSEENLTEVLMNFEW